AGIVAIVLEHPDQVGVTRAGTGDATAALLTGFALGGHHVAPVVPVAVDHLQCDGRTERLAGANTGQPLDAGLLDLHPGTAAIALHPAREIAIDCLGADRQPGGDPFDDGDQRLAVRLAGREEAEIGHAGKHNPDDKPPPPCAARAAGPPSQERPDQPPPPRLRRPEKAEPRTPINLERGVQRSVVFTSESPPLTLRVRAGTGRGVFTSEPRSEERRE